MIRLVAEDVASLEEDQVRRIRFWLLELVPARGCEVRRGPPVEITVIGHEAAELHPPLLERVEAIAGCRFRVVAAGG